MPKSSQIVAIGLLTEHELQLLGQGFDRVFPIDSEIVFEDLLRAIDEAELRLSAGVDGPSPGAPQPRRPA